MPELPDVEVYRQYCNRTILNKKIKTVSLPVKRILDSSKSTIRRHLKENKLVNTDRHGKHLFLKIGDEFNLMLHFGMTGDVEYFKNKKNKPKHTAMLLGFENGHFFSFINIRKLGKIKIVKNINEFVKEKQLGPDALSIKKKKFIELLSEKRGFVKSALMNQKSIAGVGNIYADEILFHAGVHPKKKLSQISERKLLELYERMLSVLNTAIESKAQPEQMPKKYLLRERKPNAECGICGGKIKKTELSGRPVYYCSKHQH